MVSRKQKLKIKLSTILPELDERQRRIVAAAEAVELGYGGISAVADITGMTRNTIAQGVKDLEQLQKRGKEPTTVRVRKSGGGRKKATDISPDLEAFIEKLLEPDVREDPESPLRWTCKSVRNISDLIGKQGYTVSHQTIAKILHELEFSLQGNRKTKEGKSHPDRDQQFKFINKKVKKFLKSNQPVISVDTKKKELIGNYKNVGREWSAKGSPIDVNGHDFPDPNVPKAVPCGVYDIGNDKGWVTIGISSDTAEFAVNSIRKWWETVGKKKFEGTKELMICADCGGSNSNRSTLWKRELQRLSNETGLLILISHFPPGTSKWNKIEHRLFSFISINWRGKPLVDYQAIIKLIASTKTKSGLTVKVCLDKREYKKGIKAPKEEMEKMNIKKAKFHGEWNYSISPQ